MGVPDSPSAMAPFWALLLLLLLLPLPGGRAGSSPDGAAISGTDFNYKAARVLTEEESNPKCFSEHLEDLVCLWETPQPLPREGGNRTSYTFLYKSEDVATLKSCRLKVEPTARNTTRYTCLFQREDVVAFKPIDIHVLEGHSANTSLYFRKVQVDKVVFLDPPSNLTVRLLEVPGQLNVSWQAPSLAFLPTSILHEVKISPEGSPAQVVKVAKGQTYCLIASLKGQTRYTVAVRAKPDGVSYNGYWSAWSQAVTITTTSSVDLLVLILSVFLVLIVLLLAFIALMSHRRFLKKKIWPAVPSPEHEFKDLFTIYKGNFQLWLGNQSIYLGWSQTPHFLDEQPFLLEILSEGKADCPPLPPPPAPPPLPPKTRHSVERPCSPDASQDEYLVLDEDLLPYLPDGAGGSLLSEDSASGESTDAAAGTREPSQASLSFEYTVFEPSSGSLSPWDRQAEPPRKNTYRMVSDSGISADYSPVGSNAGQTSLYTNLGEGGVQPHPFLPAYILCS